MHSIPTRRSSDLVLVSALRIAHDRAWRLVLGVLDVVLGGLLLFSGPGTGLVFLAFCVGISFLFRGVFLVVLALGLRRVARARSRRFTCADTWFWSCNAWAGWRSFCWRRVSLSACSIGCRGSIGSDHVCTPVTNAHLVC